MRQLMMGGGPTGETNTPKAPEWATEEHLPEAGFRPATDPTSMPRALYNTFVQPLSSVAGAATEVAAEAVPGAKLLGGAFPFLRRGVKNFSPQLSNTSKKNAQAAIEAASADPELAEMLKQVNLNVQPQIPRYETSHGLYAPSDEMNQPADLYELPDFFRQFQWKTPQLKAPTVQLATNPLGQAGPSSPEHMEEILRHEILGHGNQFGRQIENIRDSKSLMDAGTLMQASKQWPNLRGAPNSEMHHKDWERYAASPEEIDARARQVPGATHETGNASALEGMYARGIIDAMPSGSSQRDLYQASPIHRDGSSSP